jgi:tetratricopeptide (TPR) repeat protein
MILNLKKECKKNIFLVKLFLFIFVTAIILNMYFNCSSTTKEVSRVSKDSEITRVSQDSIINAQRVNQVNIDFNFAYQYYSHKDFKEAIPLYWKAIESDRELRYPSIYRQLGQCYLMIGVLDSAQIVYEMGAEKVPNDVYIQERLEWIYEAKFDFVKAIEKAKKVLELGGNKKFYYTKLKDLYIRNNQIKDAITIYDKLIELEPDNKELQDQKISLIKLSGGSVIDEYKRLHEKYPNDKNYIKALLMEYHRENDNSNVISMADKLLGLESDNLSALDMKSDAYANLQKWSERIAVLKRMLELRGGDDPRMLTDIAESYSFLKDYISARSYALKAIRKNYGVGYIRIGEAYEFCVEDVISKKGGYEKMTYDDKLIYELANAQYNKAASFSDLEGIANRKMNAIKNLLPTKEDKFMNPDKKTASNPEYQWIYR